MAPLRVPKDSQNPGVEAPCLPRGIGPSQAVEFLVDRLSEAIEPLPLSFRVERVQGFLVPGADEIVVLPVEVNKNHRVPFVVKVAERCRFFLCCPDRFPIEVDQVTVVVG